MSLPYLAAYGATTLVMVLIDLIWLGVIAKPLYLEGIGHLMADKPRLGPAVLFYLMYPVGLMLFAVLPGVAQGDWRRALVMGALFGLFAYATYDLTNLATLKQWPLRLALIDIAWGALVSAVATVAGHAVLSHFLHKP
jgi:uncharacterized membrane protein